MTDNVKNAAPPGVRTDRASVEAHVCNMACERVVDCRVCGRRKPPWGRDVAAAANGGYCTHECEGWNQPPYPGHLWPGELVRTLTDERDAAIAWAEKEREYTDALAVSHQAEVDALNARLAESQSQADALRAEVARLQIGHDRYEYVRTLNPRDYGRLWFGNNFDALIDKARADTDTANGGLKPKEGG